MSGLPAGDLSQLPRKQLQDLAKEHGLKANAKSQILAEQLQALRDSAQQPAAAAPAAAAEEAGLASLVGTRKRLSSLFETVTGLVVGSVGNAERPSTSQKRGRDENDGGVSPIDEGAPLLSPLEPARRQSKVMKLATATGEPWCVPWHRG